MSYLKPIDMHPAADTPWADRVEARATAAIAKNDLVIVDGLSGSLVKVSPADADATTAAGGAGVLAIAVGAAAAAGDRVDLVPWRVITSVDTSAASADGDPVYLSTTAGGWTATKPTGVDEPVVIVGQVLDVDASAGAVLLAPAWVRTEPQVISGAITISDTDTTGTAALGARYASGAAIASISARSGSSATTSIVGAAVNGSGTLTVTVNTAPTAGESVTIGYVVYGPDAA